MVNRNWFLRLVVCFGVMFLVLVVYLRWPKPLTHFLCVDTAPQAAYVLVSEDWGLPTAIQIRDAGDVDTLWNEIRKTDILPLYPYPFTWGYEATPQTITAENPHYEIHMLVLGADGETITHRYQFSCIANRVNIDGLAYDIWGESHLIPILDKLYGEHRN